MPLIDGDAEAAVAGELIGPAGGQGEQSGVGVTARRTDRVVGNLPLLKAILMCGLLMHGMVYLDVP